MIVDGANAAIYQALPPPTEHQYYRTTNMAAQVSPTGNETADILSEPFQEILASARNLEANIRSAIAESRIRHNRSSTSSSERPTKILHVDLEHYNLCVKGLENPSKFVQNWKSQYWTDQAKVVLVLLAQNVDLLRGVLQVDQGGGWKKSLGEIMEWGREYEKKSDKVLASV